MTDSLTAVEFEIPRRSGETLCLPPPQGFAALARRNAALLNAGGAVIAGAPLAQVRRRARAEIMTSAAAYVQTLGIAVDVPRSSGPLLVTGHQPFLFHPGIWLKHLLVDRVARDHGLVALSLPVDSDVAEDIGADVPRLDGTSLHFTRETLIRVDPDVPYESTPAPPERDWRAFMDRLQAHLETLPLPDAQAALQAFAQAAGTPARAPNVGTFLTAARRRYEGGRRYIELPVSQMSAGAEFRRFVLHLLRGAERFAGVYNHHLGAYRDRYNIRTTAQPFPDLQHESDRQEAPFWVIRRGRRAPLFVQRIGRGLRILAGTEPVAEVEDGAGPETLAAIAIRPRALALTAFTRLCVADLFIHGVGGGRYDRVTDDVIRDYFEIEPPAYAVATATLHLPLQAFDAAAEREVFRRRLLEIQHNPDRVLSNPTPAQQALINEKWRLIPALDGGTLARRERRQATQRIREINEELARALVAQRQEVEHRLADLESGSAATAAATYRGYPYCFFPIKDVDALVDYITATP